MTASPPSEDAPHWARPLLERQIAIAGQLAEGGLEMAMAVKDAALPEDGAVEPAVLESLSRAYARLARSTRLSLMLQDRLIRDLIAFDKKLAQDTDRHRRDRTREAKTRVEAIIERVIGRQNDDPREIERLVWETSERLDREDLYGPLLDRPVSELVAMICHDLGLDPDWPRLATEAWAQAEAASKNPGSPLKSSPVGGGGPRSGGGGMPEAAADGSFPLRHAAYPRRATSPDGGGIERPAPP